MTRVNDMGSSSSQNQPFGLSPSATTKLRGPPLRLAIYRSATRHRLQEDQAERLVLRRRDEHIGYVQDLRQLLMEQPAAEEDVGEPEASGCRCTDAPLPIRRERLHRPGD